MVDALGCALLCLVLAACFQKNFLDLSVEGGALGQKYSRDGDALYAYLGVPGSCQGVEEVLNGPRCSVTV